MKFLLTAINAKFIHSNPAIYSLQAGVGEKLQPYVELAEFTINESPESILEGIWKRQPKVIGFSCYIWNWKLIREILTELPKILPDTEIWLGGPEVTYDGPGLLREFPQVTGIMVGEGEVTFREVLDQYVREAESTGQSEQQPESDSIEQQAADRMGTVAGKSVAERFGQIPGLCLASGYTAPRELTDLTTLPFLYEDMEPFTNRIIYYETSRGCPYRCSYCLSSIDKKVRLRDIDVVKRERQEFQAALTELEVPLLPGADVVHKGLIIILRDDTDMANGRIRHVRQGEIDLTIAPAVGQRRHGVAHLQPPSPIPPL